MPPVNRRRFLQLSAAASLAPAALIGNTSATPSASRDYMLQMNGYAVNAETPLELLTDYITPLGLFFVRSHWIPRTPAPHQWSLTVDGEVGESLRLSIADLRKMRVTEVTCVLQCAGNGRGLYTPTVPGVQWRYGAVGNAHWRGVAVKDVLERAGVVVGPGSAYGPNGEGVFRISLTVPDDQLQEAVRRIETSLQAGILKA